MSADVSESDIPTPETVIKKSLVRAPEWLRRTALNALGVVTWVGLPSTVLSTLKDLRWVIDGALWLYQHAGVLKPALLAVGQGVSVAVDVWRAITHPIWQALAELLQVTIPAWAPDLLTLLALIAIGLLRRSANDLWGSWRGGRLLFGTAQRSGELSTDKVPIPRRFPYTQHFAKFGVKWTPKKLADAQRLWRKWRKDKIRDWLALHPERWPRFREKAIEAQFARYWLAVIDGRRAMMLYVAIATMLLALLAFDLAYGAGLFR